MNTAYEDLLKQVLDKGKVRKDRTGTGTLGIFGHQMRFDLAESFPLITTKKVHFKSVLVELLWFLKGDTHVGYLRENGVSIWDEWANEDGELGPVYGSQWRSWRGADGEAIDQIQNLIEGLKNDPYSRRHIVSAWNVAEIPKMALPPCHAFFQFHVQDDRLSCQLYQRSADLFLGVPFNIASYSALTRMVAQVTGLKPGEFIHTLGDVHLYLNHVEQAKLQLSRAPKPFPKLHLNPSRTNLFEFQYEDFILEGYEPHPSIKAEIAV